MAVLSTSAWVLHDLGLAAGFGGPLFGKIALHSAVKDIPSEEQRGHVLYEAWNRYNAINAISLGTMATTWLLGRTMLSGRQVSRGTQTLVLVKDVLVGAAFITGILNIFSGKELGQTRPGGAVPVYGGNEPSPRTPPKAAALQRFLGVMGPLNLALVGGVIGVTAVLAMKAGRSTKWSVISRLLP